MTATKTTQLKTKSRAGLTDKHTTELGETELDGISGGPARRTEDFGDFIGNYNVKDGPKLPDPEQWDPGEYSPSSN